MADNNFMQTGTNFPWIPEVIANESLGLLGSYLNLGNTVAKDTDLTPVRYGQKINIPRRGVISAQQKSQGQPSVVQKPTADEIQIVVDQHWYVKIAEEDFTNAFQQFESMPGYIEDSIIVLGEKIEGSLVGHIGDFPHVDVGNSAGDALKGVVDARTFLVNKKVPKLAQRYGYVSPRFQGRLLKENAVIDPKQQIGATALVEGSFGRVSGFDLFEGQLVPTVGSPGWDQNFFYLKNALVLASRPLRQPDQSLGVDATTVTSEAGLSLRLVRYYDKDEMGVVVQLDTLFGSGQNDARLGVVAESQ